MVGHDARRDLAVVMTWEAVWSWEVDGGVESLWDERQFNVLAYELLVGAGLQDCSLQLAIGNGDALGCRKEDEWRRVGKGLRLGCRAGEKCRCRGELHGCW